MHYGFLKFETDASKVKALYFMSYIKDIQPRNVTVKQHI